MISAISNKLTQTYQTVWNKRKCLRNRLRGFPCSRCVSGCQSKALVSDSGKISFQADRCTHCGICSALCPAGAFSIEGFNLIETLKELDKEKSYVVSCYRSKYKSENEMRLPCVGILPPESIVFLGLTYQGDIFFNLSECEECINSRAAERFVQQLRHVQKEIGHLFMARLLPVQTTDAFHPEDRNDRRQFLFSLGGSMADIVTNRLAPAKRTSKEKHVTKWIPERLQLLHNILQNVTASQRETILSACAPSLEISSSCTLCPRCSGMCPTGALKIRKDGDKKELSYNRLLCTACGLCTKFCKEDAIRTHQAGIVLSDF